MSKKRLLCVEDEREIYNLVRLVLSDYEVVSAETFKAAKELIAAQRFDVYLMDNFLSDGTGLELCRLIRASDEATPILFMSGSSALTTTEIADAGAQGFIKKGISFVGELEQKVRQLG